MCLTSWASRALRLRLHDPVGRINTSSRFSMSPGSAPTRPDVFVSYSSADRDRVLPIADRLAAAGISIWLDRHEIVAATSWAEEIVRAIGACKVVLLMCSDASMRSWAVKQEIQLAGERRKALLPLLLERTSFPEQIE